VNDVEGCDVDKVKTEPDDFEEEELKKDMKGSRRGSDNSCI
jgi:hypothetical protein